MMAACSYDDARIQQASCHAGSHACNTHLAQLHNDEQAPIPTVHKALVVAHDVGVLQCCQQPHLVASLPGQDTTFVSACMRPGASQVTKGFGLNPQS